MSQRSNQFKAEFLDIGLLALLALLASQELRLREYRKPTADNSDRQETTVAKLSNNVETNNGIYDFLYCRI